MANKIENVQQFITDTRKALKALPKKPNGEPMMTDAEIEAHIEASLKELREPARNAIMGHLMKAARALTKQDVFTESIDLIKGQKFIVQIEVDNDGNVQTIERTRKVRSSRSSGSTGKRPVLVLPDGSNFPNWAELVRSFGEDPSGDSGRRYYERMHEADPEKYPMPEEVDQEEFYTEDSEEEESEA